MKERIDGNTILERFTDDTALVSLMWANNETGVLFPVREIGEVCRSRGVLFHCDAVQAAGKVDIDVSLERGMQADYLTLTGHKFGAPKGIGALFVRRKSPFSPLIHGGHQEGVCLSSGSACLADSDEPSHVVKAMKPDTGTSRQMIRFSLDTQNTMREIEETIAAVQRSAAALRG